MALLAIGAGIYFGTGIFTDRDDGNFVSFEA